VGGSIPSSGAAINGYWPADFNGSTTALEATSYNTELFSANAWSIVALVKPRVTTVTHTFPGIFEPGIVSDTMYGILGLSFSTSGATAYQKTSGGTYFSVTAPCSTEAWHLLTAKYDGAALSVRVDRGPATSTAASPVAFASAHVRVGSNYQYNETFDGSIAEVFTSAKELTDAEVDALRVYVNRRYALSL
jgi:hypothetical protein